MGGCLGYPDPGPLPSYSTIGPWPHKSFNHLNLLLIKGQSLWPYAYYFQWFTGYLNHVDLLMSHVHVLKKLYYCLMCTKVVFWILSRAQLANTCSKLTIKNRLICMCSKLKINTAWYRSGVFIVDFDHSQHITFSFEQAFVSRLWKTSHNVLKTQKAMYLFHNKSYKAYVIQQFIIASNWNKLWPHWEHTMINILWTWNPKEIIIVSSHCLIC